MFRADLAAHSSDSSAHRGSNRVPTFCFLDTWFALVLPWVMSRFDKAAKPALLAPGFSTAACRMITDLSSTPTVCETSAQSSTIFLENRWSFIMSRFSLKQHEPPKSNRWVNARLNFLIIFILRLNQNSFDARHMMRQWKTNPCSSKYYPSVVESRNSLIKATNLLPILN